MSNFRKDRNKLLQLRQQIGERLYNRLSIGQKAYIIESVTENKGQKYHRLAMVRSIVGIEEPKPKKYYRRR